MVKVIGHLPARYLAAESRMDAFSDSSSISSFSCDESDGGTLSDDCNFCGTKLDPNNLVINVKTRKITARCVAAGCGRENRLGKWSGAFPSPAIVLE